MVAQKRRCVSTSIKLITGISPQQELLDLLHKIPEFAQWKTPHHAEAYETSAHVAAPHYFDDNVQSGSSTQAPPTQQAAPPKQEHHEPKAQPQQAAPAAAPQTGEHPETWGASKIKQVLDQHKIDHRGCMEKEVIAIITQLSLYNS